jgi:AraC-like DNA-binding protein
MNRIHSGLDDRIHRPDKLAVLVDALTPHDVSGERLLAGSGLALHALHDAATRVSARQLLRAYANAQRLSHDPGLALRAGMRIRITHFGLYGYALLASPTPRQAIEFAIKYRALASPLIGLSFALDGAEAVWSFDDVLALGSGSALFRFVVEMQLGTQLSLHRDLLGATVTPTRARLRYPKPAHAALYREILGCPVSFGQAGNELRFDAAWLDRPLALANPITAAMVQQTCDQMLAEISSATGMACRVTASLLRAPGRFPDVESLASEWLMTARTLRRHLKAEGTSYQKLLDEVRHRLALDYLQNTRMSTDDVAASLGYSDVANFRHAFKRWTGRTPGSCRQADASIDTA